MASGVRGLGSHALDFAVRKSFAKSETIHATRQVCLAPVSVQAVYVFTPVAMFFAMYVSRYVTDPSEFPPTRHLMLCARTGNSPNVSVAWPLYKSRLVLKSRPQLWISTLTEIALSITAMRILPHDGSGPSVWDVSWSWPSSHPSGSYRTRTCYSCLSSNEFIKICCS